VLGGSDGVLYRRWDKRCITFSKEISCSMTLTRYAELKRHIKLCVNGLATRRGEINYDPAYKYDLICKVIVNNTNSISLTTWGHRGFGESGTGITGRLRNKKVSKGGQTVLMMDRHRLRLRAYMHRTKIYDELYQEEKNGWTRNGPFELKCLSDKLLQMVDDEDGITKKLLKKNHHYCRQLLPKRPNHGVSRRKRIWRSDDGGTELFTHRRPFRVLTQGKNRS